MIGEVVVFLFKAVVIQAVLFMIYWLFLRRNTHHKLNRAFILGALVASLIVPFVEISFPESGADKSTVGVAIAELLSEPIGVFQAIETAPQQTQSLWMYISMAYGLLMLFLLGRSWFRIFLLSRIKKHCEYVTKKWFRLFKTSHAHPFSFFSNVFIPSSVFGSDSFDEILTHECAHVKKKHSFDRVLVDLLVALFWFNPFIYLYRNVLIEIHEYEADEAVLARFGDPVKYQEILFSQLQPVAYSGLVSHFNFSTIKKRIVMMNRSKNSSRSRLAYLLTLPVLAMITLSFSSKEGERSLNAVTDVLEDVAGPFENDPMLLVDQEDRFKPSIIPLKRDAKMKVSSHFGKRHDPTTDQVKYHNGIDFATAVGTRVIATADGVVHEVEDLPKTHGKIVVLLHGDTYMTRYTHLSDWKVKAGDEVKRGDVIALSGNSGRSTGPHLHYEVYENEKLMNPVNFIKNYKFKPITPDSEEVPPPPPPSKKAPKMGALHEDGRVVAPDMTSSPQIAEVIHSHDEDVAVIATELAETDAEAVRIKADRIAVKATAARVEADEIAVVAEAERAHQHVAADKVNTDDDVKHLKELMVEIDRIRRELKEEGKEFDKASEAKHRAIEERIKKYEKDKRKQKLKNKDN